MKAIRYYLLDNNLTELCQAENKNWFYRCRVYSMKYGYNWSKWYNLGKLQNAQRQTINWENLNGNEITTHCVELNFLTDRFYIKLSNKKCINGLKYRLPN